MLADQQHAAATDGSPGRRRGAAAEKPVSASRRCQVSGAAAKEPWCHGEHGQATVVADKPRAARAKLVPAPVRPWRAGSPAVGAEKMTEGGNVSSAAWR